MIAKEELKELSLYILDGMSEKESCSLAGISYNELIELKESSEQVRDHIEKMKITFKLNHLREIQKSKSEKNSQWILEKLRPEEFGTKAKPEQTTVNIISAIVKQIQNDNEPIINITRGTRIHEGESNSGDSGRRLGVTEILN